MFTHVQKSLSGLRQFFKSWEAGAGSVLLTITLAIILLGPALAPYSPTDIGAGTPNAGPSSAHWFGVDSLGRDVLSRFLTGGRQVLLLPVVAAVLAYAVGGFMGIYGALSGGAIDRFTSKAFDLLLVMPPMLLGLVVLGSAGSSNIAMGGLLALVTLPRAGRVIRGASQAIVQADYVSAARGRGENQSYIVRRELLPNIAVPILADFGVRLTYTIIFASSLSFLGFGAQPPDPDWGRMVADSIPSIASGPVGTIAPALGIALAAISVNLIAEGLGRMIERSGSRSVPAKRAGLLGRSRRATASNMVSDGGVSR